jgi:hypothetical protein
MFKKAKVTIQYSNDHYRNMGDVSDVITLYNLHYGSPYSLSGVIHMLVRAYDYGVRTKRYVSHDELVAFATSLILVSNGLFEPSTRDGYEQIKMGGCFWEPDYWYNIVLFPRNDQDGNPIVEITVSFRVSGALRSITRTLKAWRKYDEVTVAWSSMVEDEAARDIYSGGKPATPQVAASIYFNETSNQILTAVYGALGPCPCDECIVRTTCFDTAEFEGGRRRCGSKRKCDRKLVYEERVKTLLLEMLSYDSEFDKLFRRWLS